MTDPVSITVVLSFITNKIIDALLYAGSEKVVDETWGKLKATRVFYPVDFQIFCSAFNSISAAYFINAFGNE